MVHTFLSVRRRHYGTGFTPERYKNSEQPVPFLMSSSGWGIFLNTTWRHYVDLGQSNSEELLIWGAEGDLDFFLIAGVDFAELLDRYTQISGRPMLLPQWAYGLTWINFVNADQWQVLDNARRFRDARADYLMVYRLILCRLVVEVEA